MTMNSVFDRTSQLASRRNFMKQGSRVVASAAVLPYFRAYADSEKQKFVEVNTAYGRIRGTKTDGLSTFKGVPYAGSVSGANRFKSAPPLQPWTGVRDALNFGPPSIQPPRPSFGSRESVPNEDCLFLNIWTPAADGRKRPVMFYSHGGGFTVGSGAAQYQDGGNLAHDCDVVVVATNHRLGLLGFLYLGDLGGEEYATSGNQGLLDIRDGLRWVHQNIEVFGGDPNNVMIFGESGGGVKTSCLYAMPSADPYFDKASIESGPGIRVATREAAAETTLMALRQLGIEKDQWRKLFEVPADKLLATQLELGKQPGGPLTMSGGRKGMSGNSRPGGFGPVVDGAVLPHHPFDPEAPAVSKKKPLIVGSNRDETNFFFMESRNVEVFNLTEASLKERLQKEFGDQSVEIYEAYHKSRPDASPSDLYTAITTARMIGTGAVTIAERKYAQNGASVYMYIFTHESSFIVPGTHHTIGAAHALEIPYKFNNIRPAMPSGGASGQQQGMMAASDPDSVRTARNMSEMWSAFARTGHPSAKGQPNWPAYDTKRRATMEINAECKVVDDPFSVERKLWDRLDP
jgi:para-nitrobenzyl esterase